jgi:ureidoacrylate peracid hydrolase
MHPEKEGNMHNVGIRQEIIDRVVARRGRLHLFDQFEARETAMVVIDIRRTGKPGRSSCCT